MDVKSIKPTTDTTFVVICIQGKRAAPALGTWTIIHPRPLQKATILVLPVPPCPNCSASKTPGIVATLPAPVRRKAREKRFLQYPFQPAAIWRRCGHRPAAVKNHLRLLGSIRSQLGCLVRMGRSPIMPSLRTLGVHRHVRHGSNPGGLKVNTPLAVNWMANLTLKTVFQAPCTDQYTASPPRTKLWKCS